MFLYQTTLSEVQQALEKGWNQESKVYEIAMEVAHVPDIQKRTLWTMLYPFLDANDDDDFGGDARYVCLFI